MQQMQPNLQKHHELGESQELFVLSGLFVLLESLNFINKQSLHNKREKKMKKKNL